MNKHPCGLKAMLLPIITSLLWLGLVGLALAESYTLQWTEPTTREDGTYLPQEQIFSYGILVDGIYVTFSWPSQTSAIIEIDTSEPHIITMVTLDSSYNLSKPSNGVGIPLTPPVAPGICVSE